MRKISFFLALYMSLLSFMPCGDGPEHAKAHEEGIEHHHDFGLEMHSDHEHSEEADFCSPFCICACCGVVSDQPSPRMTLSEFFPGQVNSRIYNLITLTDQDRLDNIWHPPRQG